MSAAAHSRLSFLLALAALWSSAYAGGATYALPGFSETPVVTGLTSPTAVAWTPDGRMLILEKGGRVRIVVGGALQAAPALDISGVIDTTSERGLLGITLHPAFTTNGFVYLYYTTQVPKNRVSRFTMTGNSIDSNSEVVILDGIDSTNGNHNGGTIAIGPDGKLWAAPGDSGTGGAKSQDTSVGSFNGKVLRMELDGAPAAGNPFLADPTKEPRLFAYGFRNPFRFTFRSSNGALFVADVGQSSREEIDVVTAGGNYGWPAAEGTLGSCTGCIPPVFDYDRSVGGCIIGGFFVTAPKYPPLLGKYLFGDFVGNWIRFLGFDSSNAVSGTLQNLASSVEGPVNFGQGPDGAIYYVAFNSGKVYRIDYSESFYALAPCRVVDTRGAAGPFGGPALPGGGGQRTFTMAGQCGVPATARAVAVNVTVTQSNADGHLSAFPAGQPLPATSLINFRGGQTRANNAIVSLGAGGAVTFSNAMPAGSTHLIVDVTGFFQ